MPRALSCPVCRIDLGPGETHCPRCGLRIAPLPRRRPRAVEADASGGADAGATPPISMPAALGQGAIAGLALIGFCALVALLVTRGHDFVAGMSNADFFAGGIVLTGALLLGGVRVRRIVGDVETMRRRALHGGERLAHDNVRLAVATAGVLALLAALILAVLAH
jgi:hypothetical protein